VWAAGADPKFSVIDFRRDVDHLTFGQDRARPTYKKGFGFHPLLAFLDGTGEALAGILRPGNAGSNTAADHITVLDAALAQLPVDPHKVEVIARADSAGLTHGFIDACVTAGVKFTVGHDLTEPVRTACLAIPPRAWVRAITADGTGYRDEAEIAEITNMVNLERWPAGTRMIVRREIPLPVRNCRSPISTDADSKHSSRIRPTPTSPTSKPSSAAAVAVATLICNLKDTGCTNLPSADFQINQAG
jgi:hypothetical protein